MKAIIVISILAAILVLFIYTRTKHFRHRRANRLNNSMEFLALVNSGFKLQRIGDFIVYQGRFSDFNFLIYLDYSDYYFKNDFSIVFVSPYSEISNDKFKELNDKYYNRVKSLLVNSEYIFFDKEYVQFRYTKNVIRMKPEMIRKKLEKIRKILASESMNPTDFGDLNYYVKRNY